MTQANLVALVVIVATVKLAITTNELEELEKDNADESEEDAPLDSEFDDRPPESDYDPEHQGKEAEREKEKEEEEEEEDEAWVGDAVRDVAFYLRAHKFSEWDRRFVSPSSGEAQSRARTLHAAFPTPPLRALHWQVRSHCEKGPRACLLHLQEKALLAEHTRATDGAVRAAWRRWNNSTSPDAEEEVRKAQKECERKWQLDFVGGLPFEGPLERFQWRTTASYYMCWFTMRRLPPLAMLGEPCDNHARCLEGNLSAHNGEVRADDRLPFACARYSFCPDPCCPARLLTANQTQAQTKRGQAKAESACVAAGAPCASCALEASRNTDFVGLVLNQWNTTCPCGSGYAWQARFRACVDEDECAAGTHGCHKTRHEACFNLPGSHRCACAWGYVRGTGGGCEPLPVLGQGAVRRAGVAKRRLQGLARLLRRARDRVKEFYQGVKAYVWPAPPPPR